MPPRWLRDKDEFIDGILDNPRQNNWPQWRGRPCLLAKNTDRGKDVRRIRARYWITDTCARARCSRQEGAQAENKKKRARSSLENEKRRKLETSLLCPAKGPQRIISLWLSVSEYSAYTRTLKTMYELRIACWRSAIASLQRNKTGKQSAIKRIKEVK